MRGIIISIFILLLFQAESFAQSAFLPKNLGNAVNSPYDDINPVISPDGKTLFFVRVNHPENKFGSYDSEDIWSCTALNDSTWSVAKRIPELNITRHNAVLGIDAAGRTILLNGIFNKKGNFWKKRGLSLSTLQGSTWSKPVPLPIKKLSRINSGLKSSGSMNKNVDEIVLSLGSTYNSELTDIFVISHKEGKWTKPQKANALNSPANDDAAFVSADGKSVYFSSDRLVKGEFNIYKAERTGTDWNDWSRPQMLSDTINSADWESYFKTNSKGTWGYFSSTHGTEGKADIFKIKLLEENPFVIVSGQVVNSKNQRPIRGKEFSIAAPGISKDSLKINYDSGTYQVKLPLNNVYQLTASLPNFISKSTQVDVRGKKEFTKKKVNLYLTPLPYVRIRGKLLIQSSKLPIPAAAKSQIQINNVSNDSIKIDLQNSTYEMKINHGTSYQVNVIASRFETLPNKLDLTAVEEYTEMNFDLFVSEEKMAVVTGKILDKKTNKPLSKLGKAMINVEGMSTVFANVDTLQATYELKLPLGNLYTISASAPNYYPLYESVDTRNETSALKIYKDLVIIPIEVGESIRLNNIFFDLGKATLKKESFAELDRVADFFIKNPEIKIEISGHTDNTGTASNNIALSQSRAQSVADYIANKGVPKDRVVAKGYGFSKPVASNATKEGKAKNRRVEFTVLDK